MTYAIIDFQGHQYQVKEEQELIIDRLKEKEGSEIEIDNILLINENGKIKIGTPLVKGAKVTAKVLEHFKGKKIRVATYKAKSRYRRVKGFRPYLTKIKIKKIKSPKRKITKNGKNKS